MKSEDGTKMEAMEEEELMDDEIMDEEEEGEEDGKTKKAAAAPKQVFIPGKSVLDKEDGEELEFDPSAYRFLESFTTEHPCLSFDVIPQLSQPRQDSPISSTFVAGTQADNSRHNAIILARISNVKSKAVSENSDSEDESSSSSEDEEDEEEKGGGDGRSTEGGKRQLHLATIPHHGGVNRIRAAALSSEATVAAVWNEAGKVQIWNLREAIKSVEKQSSKSRTLKGEKPLQTYAGHGCEGFALGWSSLRTGGLASGDNRGRIFVWEMGEGGVWTVNPLPLTGHKGSVEEVVWSPSEPDLLASAGSDASIGLWDIRLKGSEARVLVVPNAHDGDVNVMSWNGAESTLATGGDDGAIKVWDLRTLSYGESAAELRYHSAPISSVEWCPGPEGEGTVLAASGEDDQVSIWDIAVETEDLSSAEESQDLPPQLLFMHLGQKEVKELHWSPDATGALLTTALDGFNFFRTISI